MSTSTAVACSAMYGANGRAVRANHGKIHKMYCDEETLLVRKKRTSSGNPIVHRGNVGFARRRYSHTIAVPPAVSAIVPRFINEGEKQAPTVQATCHRVPWSA